VPVSRQKFHLPMPGVQRPTHSGYDVVRVLCVGRERILYKKYLFLGDYNDGFDRFLLVLDLKVISESLQASFW
jgi:hypothetical protein